MKNAMRLALVVALAFGGAPLAPAQDIQTEIARLSLGHQVVTCMVAGQNPMIEARIAPDPYVEWGRVYFHSALDDTFYYVEMVDVGGLFVGTLPQPTLEASPVTYYVEGMASNYSQTQTTQNRSIVVEGQAQCEGRLAAIAPSGTPVQVYSTTGTTALPPGFTGVGTVLAGAGTTAAATTAAATTAGAGTTATGSFITSTGGIALLGAAAIGVTTAVVATTGGEEPPPVSPSQ